MKRSLNIRVQSDKLSAAYNVPNKDGAINASLNDVENQIDRSPRGSRREFSTFITDSSTENNPSDILGMADIRRSFSRQASHPEYQYVLNL